MMTVFVLRRIENPRARRQIGKRYWTPEFRIEPGSATPGRGGRRKRRAIAAMLRDVESVLRAEDPETAPSTGRKRTQRLVKAIDGALSSKKRPGYRIRRREAKKRRRRERRAVREAYQLERERRLAYDDGLGWPSSYQPLA